MAGEPAPDDLLGGAFAVHVGGVDEVAAALDVGGEDVAGCLLIGFRAESHGAKSEG
jgi:hypothetical protein